MPPSPLRKRTRLIAWLGAAVVIGLDALIATPVGLPTLYFVPIVMAAMRLPRAELLLLALVCSAARIFFGPVGDPLSLARVTFTVGEDAQLVSNAVSTVVGYVGAGWLVVTLATQQRAIRALADETERDPLTGLANRRALELFQLEEAGRLASVLALDLDHFKRINDTHGHAAGDAVLREVARRLSPLVRHGDLVARVGGEEILVILKGAGDAVAHRVAQSACEAVRGAPVEIEGGSVDVTTSVGVAVGPLDDALLTRADAALYAAKAAGRDRWVSDTSPA